MGNQNFSQHFIDNRHSIALMENIMEVLHTTKKGNMMNTLESFHMYKVTKLHN